MFGCKVMLIKHKTLLQLLTHAEQHLIGAKS
jgi:hypothetical protein